MQGHILYAAVAAAVCWETAGVLAADSPPALGAQAGTSMAAVSRIFIAFPSSCVIVKVLQEKHSAGLL